MRYPQVLHNRLKIRGNITTVIGRVWGNPTHYQAGLERPRYPMPAIPYIVDIRPDIVEILNPVTYAWDAWFSERLVN